MMMHTNIRGKMTASSFRLIFNRASSLYRHLDIVNLASFGRYVLPIPFSKAVKTRGLSHGIDRWISDNNFPSLEERKYIGPGCSLSCHRLKSILSAFVTAVLCIGLYSLSALGSAFASSDPSPDQIDPKARAKLPAGVIELTDRQLGIIKVEPASRHRFKVEKTSLGSIDYNQDALVQVFSPYSGRIINVSVQLGDRVKVGQVLYTIDSPDLLQAESTLIQTAGVNDLTSRTLSRARKLVPAGGGAQKDLDQAVSDQQTAEGNLKAAQNVLRIFGKKDEDIAAIIDKRALDANLVIKSPVDGIVTARNGASGVFVQPGGVPAPLTIADISTKWMIASLPEGDSAALRIGQEIEGRMFAVPNQTFRGRLTAISEAVDLTTHRIQARSEIADPENVLRPGMFGNFVIQTGLATDRIAIPLSGVVREGDGTMTIWIARDNRQFSQRIVRIGLQQDGLDEVIEGLSLGEKVVTDGAVFLSNVLNAPPTD